LGDPFFVAISQLFPQLKINYYRAIIEGNSGSVCGSLFKNHQHETIFELFLKTELNTKSPIKDLIG
jgi:hypothetical protein